MRLRMTGAAVAALLASFCLAQAADKPGGPGGPGGKPGGPPPFPPEILAFYGLGEAGLLYPFLSNDQYGVTQERMGQGRFTIGAVDAGLPPGGFKYRSFAGILPVNAFINVGGGFIRIAASGVLAEPGDDKVPMESRVGRLDAQYLHLLGRGTMIGGGVFFDVAAVGDQSSEAQADRRAFGLRVDALHRLSDTWGVAARAEYGWGTSEFSVPIAPGLKLRHDQGDDRAYAQVDLVGAYTSRHWDAIPERWALHPNIGAQFQRSFIEATADSFGAVSSGVLGDTEDYAAGWLRLRAEKKPRGPFELLPAIGLGLEAELADSLDRESDESLWANLVLGAGMVLPHGARVDAEYNLHYGLTGTSVQHSVVLSLSAAF